MVSASPIDLKKQYFKICARRAHHIYSLFIIHYSLFIEITLKAAQMLLNGRKHIMFYTITLFLPPSFAA